MQEQLEELLIKKQQLKELQLEKKLEIRVQVGLNRNSPLLFSSQNLLEQSKEFSLVSNLSLKN